MKYIKFPNNTKLTNEEFIKQMNLALLTVSSFEVGMEICFDDNGYWLERNGAIPEDSSIIMSEVRTLVLGN